MTEVVWEESAAESGQAVADIDECTGSLVQIYPLQLDRGLIPLRSENITMGRGNECDFVIREDCVSRVHACIERSPGGYVIRDLDSTNGTWLNEQPVTSHWLKPGDRIRIGTHIFRFVSANDVESQYQETVYTIMTRDGLTGAWNKRSFLDAIERDVSRAARTQHSLTLAVLDIDHFKTINETHGQLAGDQVLRQLCRRISPLIPRGDLLARYSGQQFAVLLAGSTAEDAAKLAEACRKVVEETPFETSEGPVPVTVSIGAAELSSIETEEEPRPDQLIARADVRLAEAKRSGRNRVCV